MLYVGGETNGRFQLAMEDVHKEWDEREIAIDLVGVDKIQYPIVVSDRDGAGHNTVAQLSMSVNLPHNVKGTHMSRFIEILREFQHPLGMDTLPGVLHLLKERLGADTARVEVDFPYFLERVAPVSRAKAPMGYECSYFAEANCDADEFMVKARVPVCALCPCSKKISDYGAHNQRGYVTIEVWPVRTGDGLPVPYWIEDLIEIAETSASAPVYPLLKRPDERYVTMQAHDNPAFVEDIVRAAATQLSDDPRVERFRVHAENHESIHSHNVFASVEGSRGGARK